MCPRRVLYYTLEFWPDRQLYLIVAGPFDDAGAFGLYTWSGNAAESPQAVSGINFGSLHPEVVFVRDSSRNELQILSDDGGRKIGASQVECKHADPSQQSFRALGLKW